ncbi:MAG: AAA family ATPase [Candidatus Coproplasma sp.]
MSDVTFITGAKGGSGATTCAVKAGLALAANGERTLYVDGDALCASGMQTAGVENLCSYTLADALRGACRVKQAIINHPLSPNFYVLPSLGCSDGKFICNAVNSLAPSFDRILCDNTAISVCNRAVLVSEPYPVHVRNAGTAAARLKDGGFTKVELIVNKVNGGLVFDGAILTPQEYATLVRCELAGVIPEDLLLPLSGMKSSTKKAFNTLAQRLMGGEKIYDVIKPYYGVKGKIKRKMRYWI